MSVRLDKNYEPLPGYRLIERLGRGGFGEVWKVEAPGQLYKAMKFVFGNLDSQDDDGRPAEQELKALNRVKAIRHPYILSLERIDIIDGQLLIVMELADRSLWDRFRECRQQKKSGIPREELLLYMAEAAEALDLMNDNYHIQHLDVKPQNLFLLYNHVKVADFGLAKAFEGGRGTITGGVTPVYAAPETFEGYASRFTDQYSLAICFQELLTGTRPFNGSNTKQLLMQHLNGVPDLSALPSADKPIIAKALSKKPDDRWASCLAMVQALRTAALSDTPTPGGTLKETVPTPNRTPIPSPGYRQPKSEFNDAARTRIGTGDFAFARPAPGGGAKSAGLKLVTARDVAAAVAGRPVAQSLSPVTQRPTVAKGKPVAKPVAPAELTADGSLMPALLVGIGAHGRMVLQRVRAMLREEFGSREAYPHLHFLYVDTDADELAAAQQPETPGAFATDEVYHARLNRSAHYLQRDGLPPVEPWMPPGLLYQLPREPKNANGIRSYGRLALFDHIRPLRQRLRESLSNIANDEFLKIAATQTGRGIRTNRPRAYVIAAATGGTGSGMALDFAYLLKNEFRQAGYPKPTVHGVVFVPAADKTRPKSPALANGYAFLEELKHFATKGTVYHTRFDTAEAPVSEGEGPFSACQAIQLPDSPTSPRLTTLVGSVARGMVLDLTTPLGQVVDSVRTEAQSLPRHGGPVIQTTNHFRMTWPRNALLRTIRTRFSAQLLTRWAGRESTHLREPIRLWLGQEWGKRELELEQIVEKLNHTVEETLREKPSRVFEAFVEPLRVSYHNGGKFSEKAACDVFEELVKIVGGPNPEADALGKLEETLKARARILTIESEGNLSALTVSFIEQPQYRLAGADEALAQIGEKLTMTIDSLENIRKGLIRELHENYQKLYTVMQQLAKDETGFFGGRRGGLMNDLCELLRRYPNSRLKLSVLETALSFYRGLQAQGPDLTHEIGTCRARLLEMAETMQATEATAIADEPVLAILPPGCETMAAAADEFIGALSPDDLLAFENDLQHAITRKLRGIVSVATKPELVEDFLPLFERKSLEFLEPRLEKADPAEMFLRYREHEATTPAVLGEAFDCAAPDLTSISGAAPAEATILAAPAGPNGARLKAYLGTVFEGIEFIPAPLESDIVLYREYPLLEIAELPQTAAHAREAYEARLGSETPPHARYDIAWKSH
jgi:hypothetical protein